MTNGRRWGALVSAIIAQSAFCTLASANDPATATMLFNEAKRLASAGSYVEACPKFEESQRLDPGIGTQYNLADCYEHVGRTASAWAMFQDAASAAKIAGQAARADVAHHRASALEAKVPKLTIVAPKNATGLEVRRNGELLGSVLWGNAIPVDPGSYTIEASAPGKKRWSSVATVGPNGANVTVTIPSLEDADLPVGAAPVPESSFEPAAQAAPPASESPALPHSASAQRTASAVVASVGVVGIGIGAYFGVESFSKHSDYVSHCSGGFCDATGLSGHADAVTAGNVATVAFLAGGALVATGAVLWFTSPKTSSTTGTGVRVVPLVAAGTAGLSVGGGWQ
jgi:hypothetical protein